MEERIEKIAGALERPLWYVCMVIFMFLTFLIFEEVVSRYLFGKTHLWADEISTYLFIFIVFFWAGPIMRRGTHIRLELFLGKIKWKGLHSFLINLFILILCIFFIIWGIGMVKMAIELRLRTFQLVYPIWPFYLLFPVGFGIKAIYSLLEVLKALYRLKG